MKDLRHIGTENIYLPERLSVWIYEEEMSWDKVLSFSEEYRHHKFYERSSSVHHLANYRIIVGCCYRVSEGSAERIESPSSTLLVTETMYFDAKRTHEKSAITFVLVNTVDGKFMGSTVLKNEQPIVAGNRIEIVPPITIPISAILNYTEQNTEIVSKPKRKLKF